MSLADVALDLVLVGWHVFPLKPRAKVPATPRGFHDATDDPERVERWWARNPNCNVGIATGASGLLVVDLDTGGAGHCGEALGNLCVLADRCDAEHLTWTYEVTTPSGGEHWYYRLRGSQSAPNSAGRLGRHIDIRSTGGYVVACGSVLDNGTYVTGADEAVADAPDWLVAACQPQATPAWTGETPSTDRYDRYIATAVDAETGRVALAPVGTRNDTLNTASYNLGQLVGGGVLDRLDAYAYLLAAGLRAGLGETEADRTICSGLMAGMRSPRRPGE